MKELSGSEKREAVEKMFDSIAWRYDFLNHFLSLGIDRLWRRKAIKIIGKTHKPRLILDIATGTGDLAIAALKLDPEKIIGIDISERMLEICRQKIENKKLSGRIELRKGDSENIEFKDDSFDLAMVAFGVRNFSDPLAGLKEMRRIINPGGMVMVLEFSKPVSFPLKQVYNFYFLNILPLFGRYFSKDSDAYRYLPESVIKFPDNEKFLEILLQAGFIEAKQIKLSGGIASIYTAIKP